MAPLFYSTVSLRPLNLSFAPNYFVRKRVLCGLIFTHHNVRSHSAFKNKPSILTSKFLESCILCAPLLLCYGFPTKTRKRKHMLTSFEEQTTILSDHTLQILHELHFGIHRLGYQQLLFLIPCYALDNSQGLTKELYPRTARHYGYSSWQPIERTIRTAILDAWSKQDYETWNKYFPGIVTPPSNKQFIATIAEAIKSPSRLKEGRKDCQEDVYIRGLISRPR